MSVAAGVRARRQVAGQRFGPGSSTTSSRRLAGDVLPGVVHGVVGMWGTTHRARGEQPGDLRRELPAVGLVGHATATGVDRNGAEQDQCSGHGRSGRAGVPAVVMPR